MTTDKELADAYRLVANDYTNHDATNDAAEWGDFPDALIAVANELDPPKPTWPDGTIAWVTIVDLPMKKYLGVRVGDEWRDGYGPDDLRRRLCAPSVNVKVEPLRVLGDDEIALPKLDLDTAALRDLADCHDFPSDSLPRMSLNARQVVRFYARAVDALDAEAGDR